jgi:hypothetical protein
MTKKTDAERAEAIQRLKRDIKLKPGETVWTISQSVNRSGDRHAITLFVVRKGRPLRISHLAARAIGLRYDRDNVALIIRGGGMDMGFEAVYQLGAVLWPRGVKRGYNGLPQTDGGYALRQERF